MAVKKHDVNIDPLAEHQWQTVHARKCKANYKESVPAMETEGVKCIFVCVLVLFWSFVLWLFFLVLYIIHAWVIPNFVEVSAIKPLQ